MLRPEYLYYYMTGVYPAKASPIFQGCKDNAFVSHGKHLRDGNGDGMENDDEETGCRRYICFI